MTGIQNAKAPSQGAFDVNLRVLNSAFLAA
jgi:hypothetical protein